MDADCDEPLTKEYIDIENRMTKMAYDATGPSCSHSATDYCSSAVSLAMKMCPHCRHQIDILT